MSSTVTDKTPTNGAAPPPAPRQKITSMVLAQITALQSKSAIDLPADYSVANALNAAWLKLQEVQNLDKKPLIVNGELSGIVTPASVANALHDMVIQGLTVAKNQGYFIVYGDKLVWQRSYFGDMAIAKRVKPGIHFYFDVIRVGDKFSLSKANSKLGMITTIGEHTQAFPLNGLIQGAYCGAVDENGEQLGVDVMDIERIKKSWGMSKTFGKSQSTPHVTFEAEMAMRTVIRHRCKEIINSSNDALLLSAVRRQDEEAVAATIDAEAEELGNGDMLALGAPAVGVEPAVAMPVAVTSTGDDETDRDEKAQGSLAEDPGY